MIKWKTTIIFGILGGTLIGSFGGGMTSLILWFGGVLILGKADVAPESMVVLVKASIAVGAVLGAVTGLVAGSVAHAINPNKWDVLTHSTNGSSSSGISAGAGITLSALLNPIYAVAVAALLAPCVIFLLDIKCAFTYIFMNRTMPSHVVIVRILLGYSLGFFFGIIGAGLIAFAAIVILSPWVATPDTIADLVGIIGPIVGAWSGGTVAMDKSIDGGNMRSTIYLAIEGGTIAGVAVAIGTVLSWIGFKILGIGVAAGIVTLWNVTRSRASYRVKLQP